LYGRPLTQISPPDVVLGDDSSLSGHVAGDSMNKNKLAKAAYLKTMF
jgi:hypothetical protein